MPLTKELLLVISRSGLSVYLTRLYVKPPAMVPITGPNIYAQIPLKFRITMAGPMLLAGFIDAPETGLSH